MHPSLHSLAHRPYPLPDRPWVMQMRWLNLCFMHWEVPVELISSFLPQGLEPDLYEGKAYIGLVPFEMRDVKPRFSPSVEGLSHFVELNVRTYVTAEGKAGVWFFSLDAANRLAVRLARASFFLPYFDAQMSCMVLGERIYYQSKRTHKGAKAAHFVAQYEPDSDIYLSQQGSLEHFLTERYCLYSADKQGQVYRGEIHHEPWPLQKAKAQISVNTLTEQLDYTLPDTAPLLHFAKAISVVAWLPQKIG
ncbi:MAG: DUF2071 domain-containing protein [Trueperaceae bacterium]|nr:DUF2071 domain-containing protein [Trueperaceae bacterium]